MSVLFQKQYYSIYKIITIIHIYYYLFYFTFLPLTRSLVSWSNTVDDDPAVTSGSPPDWRSELGTVTDAGRCRQLFL